MPSTRPEQVPWLVNPWFACEISFLTYHLMMKLERRYWPWGILLLGFLVFALLVITRPKLPPPALQTRIWQVEAMEIQPQRLGPVLTLYGEIETPALMQAVANENSRVTEVRVREGQSIDQGRLLVALDPRDFEPNVIQARADVAELQAQLQLERERYASSLQALQHEQKLLQLLKAQVVRMEKLKRRNLGSEAALDQARMEMERQSLAVTARKLEVQQHPARLAQIEARLDRARATLAKAQLALERSRIQAPFPGIVAKVEVALGDYVKANQPLVSIYPMEALEVRAKIPVPYQHTVLRALESGHTLKARGESLGGAFDLRLNRLSGKAEAGGIDALFAIRRAEDAALRLALPVTVRLSLPPRENVVPVPYGALYGSDRVYRIQAGRLESLKVKPLGNYTHGKEDWILIQSPELRKGDLILLTHLPAAAEGLPVEAKVTEGQD